MTNYSEMTDNELDRLVAEKVMGWEWKYVGNEYSPTTDTARAIDQVVDKMIEDGWFVDIQNTTDKRWSVEFWNPRNLNLDRFGLLEPHLPRAICIASLMAKESEE